MPPYDYIHVIANPATGQDAPVLRVLNRVFQQYEVDWQIDVTLRKGDGARLAKQALEAGADLIVAYGGDGTVGDVAAGMLDSDVPLAIVPGGTANALALGLGIDPGPERAVEQIFESTPRGIDLGRANDELFILRMNMGLTIETQATREAKERLGMLAYVAASIEVLGKPNQIQFEMTIDGQTIQTEGIACIVTNHNELGALGLTFGPKVDPGDGLLDVFIVGTVGEALSAVASGLINLQEDATTGLRQWQGREIHIVADPPQAFGLDGDPAGETPVSIQILPRAVRVLVPPVLA